MSTSNTNPSDIFPNTTWVVWGSGKVPVGVDSSDTDFNTSEKTGGAKSHSYTPAGTVGNTTLTAAQSGCPAHNHGFTQPTITVDSKTLTGSVSLPTTILLNAKTDLWSNDATGIVSIGAASTNDQATVSGSGALGSYSHKRKIQVTATHNHTAKATGGAVANSTAKNATSAHNHGFTGTQVTMNHLQPYITCYMWKRTA